MEGEIGVATALQIWESKEKSTTSEVAMGHAVAKATEMVAMKEVAAKLVGANATTR